MLVARIEKDRPGVDWLTGFAFPQKLCKVGFGESGADDSLSKLAATPIAVARDATIPAAAAHCCKP
jgi:hypothetical protein